MRATFVVVAVALTVAVHASPQTQQQTQPPPRPTAPPPGTRDAVPTATGAPAAPARPPLPALSPDAQRLFDQLKQNQSNVIEQLRFLQMSYRDAGRAEDAAAIAAHVRQLQQRLPPVQASVSAELVHEGLPTRDDPVRMSMFRHLVGQVLSFAIKGRDDQPVWGTTTYTDDSGLESAAVHAGLLRPGQTGIVKVALLPGQETYVASSQNGVRSNAYTKSD